MKEDFSLDVEGINIAGQVYIPSMTKKAPALILCHGVPATPPDPSDQGYPLLVSRFSEQGFTTLVFNFRGTGLSGGNFDLLGWSQDLKAVLNYALSLKGIDHKRVALMGFSGGAAVSIFVAAQDPRVSAVVALACPAQFREDGAGSMLEHGRQVGIIRDKGFPSSINEWWSGFLRLNPIQWIDKISPRPIFLIYGEKDELFPLSQANSLFEKAKRPKEIAIIPEAGHRLRRDERATNLALSWLKNWAGLT